MQNFKPHYIHDYDGSKAKRNGRPSRGQIHWYGATDEGLTNVHPNVHLWGTKKEIERFRELKEEKGNILTDLEIAEIVVAEDWPTTERKDHERYIHGFI